MFEDLLCNPEELHHEPWCGCWEAIEENRSHRNWHPLVGQDETWDEWKYEGCNLLKQLLDTGLEATKRETHLSWITTCSATIGLW